MLGGSTLASWGTLGRSWGIGEHKKGHFEVQAWIFIDFWCILGLHFERFAGALDQQCVFCYACFQAYFSNSFWL